MRHGSAAPQCLAAMAASRTRGSSLATIGMPLGSLRQIWESLSQTDLDSCVLPTYCALTVAPKSRAYTCAEGKKWTPALALAPKFGPCS